MLRSLKKPVLMQPQTTRVDLFVEHYDQLKRWAVQFTEGDQDAAEDLLHDTFIGFTLGKPELSSIQNVDGYLYVVMRNLHHSEIRRAMRMPVRSFSVIEFDTAEMPFWASDPRDHLKMRDELVAVCQFACIRKETSKGASLLILRFFHGYYPDEIAEIMRTLRSTANTSLNKVRGEVRLYLSEPDRLAVLGDKSIPALERSSKYSTDRDLRLDLRKQIFDSRQGECLAEEQLRAVYESRNGEGPDRSTLAHIVSCETCIETVNALLGLPPLASRYPVDTLGNDPTKRGDPGGGGAGGGGGKMLNSYIRRRDIHYFHEPQELCISVNGQFQSLQKIVFGKGEFTLSLDTNESLGFIEVFSEVGVRLLILNVDPFPEGDGKQSEHVKLSFGRTIDANLSFSGAFPSLQVTYNDPELAASSQPEGVVDISIAPAIASGSSLAVGDALLSEPRPVRAQVAGGLVSKLSDKLRGFTLASWLQPARITTAFAALLIVALLLFKFGPVGTVSAAELLNKSAEQEIAQLANKERVLHRTLDLEEYRDGQLASRKKIDVWHSAELGVTARRLYNDQGKLETGDWRNTSGIQTIYQKGQPAKLQPLPEKRGTSVLFEDAWQLSLSAKEFNTLIANSTDATYEERTTDYLISYQPKQPNTPLVKAAIVLSKEDLHAIHQTFTVRYGEERREYRMTEAAYEWRPVNTVAPAVFEPNVELTGDKSVPSTVVGGNLPAVNANTFGNSNTSTAPTATLATAALEVKVIDLLNSAGAFMGEQIDVSRTADGKITVNALVETDKRKAELSNALASVKNNPAVRIRIETVAEAQAREAKNKKAGQPQSMTVDSVTATENSSPVYNDLRKKFSESEARAFADRILRRSSQARRHALAAKQLSDRFSQTDLASLTPGERGKWIGLINGHAAKFLAEYASLQRELESVFPDLAGGGAGRSVTTDKEIQAAVRELYNLSVACDEDLRGSFALLTTGGSAEVKTAKFWRSLNNAAATARSLQSAR